MKKLFSELVKSVVPVCSKDGSRVGFSFGDPNFIGTIFANVEATPDSVISMNITLAHELGHQALMIYQQGADFFQGRNDWVYSGVRKTQRPAIASLHGAVALGYMIICIRSLQSHYDDIISKAFLMASLETYSLQLDLGLKALLPIAKTEICQKIIDDLTLVLE